MAEAQRIIDERKREIARQLPMLERDSHELMSAGLAIAWIIIICSFAAVQVTLRKVVRPIEDLSLAADAIASGDLGARAPVAGDFEVARLAAAVNHMADELKAHARTDELTSLPNFRAFRERIDLEIERAERYPERFGILILDLDRFKKYNDTYGHLAGNDALQRVARAIREAVRVVDFPARYGGEEFAVILPQIDAPALAAIAERIRATIEAMPAPAGRRASNCQHRRRDVPRRRRQAPTRSSAQRMSGCTRRKRVGGIGWWGRWCTAHFYSAVTHTGPASD